MRLGLKNIEVIAIHLEKLAEKRPELIGAAHGLLFDPPCSALGTRPKLFLEQSQKDLEDFASNQRRLLKLANQFVKSKGYLMYNTCTIPKEENEQIVSYALEKFGYKIIPLPQPYCTLGNSGLSTEQISSTEATHLRRFTPTYDEGVGYFIALLQKDA
jgi:methyltransferase NSUN6